MSGARRPRYEFSARYSGEAGRTPGQKHRTRPLILPQTVTANQRPVWGHTDQSEARIRRHADPWNNFTLLTPAPATPPSLSPTANSPLSTRILNMDQIFRGWAKTSILSSAVGWLRHKAGPPGLLDDYNTLPYRGHKLQILFVPPIKCQHSVMHGPRLVHVASSPVASEGQVRAVRAQGSSQLYRSDARDASTRLIEMRQEFDFTSVNF